MLSQARQGVRLTRQCMRPIMRGQLRDIHRPTRTHQGPSALPHRLPHTPCRASTSEAAAATTSQQQPPAQWKIAMLHDGDCPLCEREVNMLKGRDTRGAIKFVDIASPDYRPEDNAGISYEDAMGKIHAILPDGTIVTGVEVFRRLYEAVGLGWVYAATRNPAVATVANAAYDVWARFRLQLTGRPALDKVLLEREKRTCADVKDNT